MSFHREHLVKSTRKRHSCDWCGMNIEVGSRAVSQQGKWEGDMYHGYLHLECAAARDSSEWVRDEGYDMGEQSRGRTEDHALPPEFTEDDYFKKRPSQVKEASE